MRNFPMYQMGKLRVRNSYGDLTKVTELAKNWGLNVGHLFSHNCLHVKCEFDFVHRYILMMEG